MSGWNDFMILTLPERKNSLYIKRNDYQVFEDRHSTKTRNHGKDYLK